jgi:hypothetical protein
LDLCYRALFDFYLDWQDIKAGSTEFSSLSTEEMEKAGLVPEVAEQLRFVKEIYRLAKKRGELNHANCFRSFIHFIRLNLKTSARTEAEWKLIEEAETHGLKFAHEQRVKEELEKLFYASWVFDCPICYGVETMVAELDDVDVHGIVADRCACVQCGFAVGKGVSYISQVLLAAEISKNRAKILKEFGIRQEH